MEDIQFILSQLPSQLLGDLQYCRRALCDFSNVHLMLSPCLNNSLEGNGAFKLVVFLETLENEMRSIEKELSSLMEKLKTSMEQLSGHRDTPVTVEHMNRVLDEHNEHLGDCVIQPQCVTIRCTVSELLDNYRIFTEGFPPSTETIVLSSSSSSIEWLDNETNEHASDNFKEGYESATLIDRTSTVSCGPTKSTKRRRSSKGHPDSSAQRTSQVITVSTPETSPEPLSDNSECQESTEKLQQIEFLKNFNLVTHEVTSMLKKRRSKRMRVQTERKDYTYTRKKRVSIGAVENVSSNNVRKPRGRPKSCGAPISG